MPSTRPLDPIEIRVLGALLEKEQTTPDQYPLTVNALIAACNQKTNREPVTDLTETQVVEALDRLRLDVLTWRTEGARVERWEHRLDRRWHLTPPRKAIMTLLLLRGPQTAGELKTRSQRMHAFDDVDEVEGNLREMAESGEDRLVQELPKAPGQRENRWQHVVGTEETLPSTDDDEPAAPGPAVESEAEPVERGPSSMDRLEALEDAVEGLEDGLGELRAELRALRVRLGDLEE